MCCPPTEAINKSDSNSFSSYLIGGLHEDKLYDTLQGMLTTNAKRFIKHRSLLHIESNPDRIRLLSPTHGLEQVKLAREPASSRPKPDTFMINASGVLHVRRSLSALVGTKQVVIVYQLSPQNTPGPRL